MEHTIKAAMECGELTEEEAYFILRFAGHIGYDQAIKKFDSVFNRARKWFIWFGGWEYPKLMQWDFGKPFFEIKGSPTPISILGYRITFHDKWLNVNTRWGEYIFRKDLTHEWRSFRSK